MAANNMSYDDEKIVTLCQCGDLEKFGLLYERYIRKIYDFIYYKTTHKETAEDLTSLTFAKALEKIRTFDKKKGTFSAWLYQIARNSVIDHYRAKKTDANIDDVWDLAGHEDVARDIDAKQKLAAVEKYLANLTSEQREIVTMRVWQEMSYYEIARALGKSEDASKMAFSRAINKLHQEMPAAVFIAFIFI